MTAAEAIEMAKENGYSVFGLRIIDDESDTHEYHVGEYVPDSYDWDFDQDCSTRETDGRTLPGASAIRIGDDWMEDAQEAVETAMQLSKNYVGHTVLVIAGESYQYGDDDNEVIIRDAKCIWMGKK